MKIFKKLKIKPGFSLMEVLVVLFIISTALLGILSLLIQNIQVQSINKNNLIASSLSQEGIELVRQIRDMNWQYNLPFNTHLTGSYYRVDFQTNEMIPTFTASDYQLFLKNGLYVHSSGNNFGLTPTIFSRQIVIDRLNGDIGKPLQVRSIVSWTDRSHPYHYELQTLLYDWH